MKKLLFLLIVLFSFPLMGQERELSDYEKYRMEKEKELYAEEDTTKADTVYVVEEQAEPVVINNYYIDNEPSLRFNLLFGYSWRPYYQPYYYGYYDPFYYDYWYWNDWYYWSWNWYIPTYYSSWYYRPHYRYYNHSRPYYSYTSRYYNGRHTATNTLGWNRDYYRPNYKQTVGRSSTASITPKRTVAKNAQVVRKPVTTRTMTRTSESTTKRTYSPTYSKPRTAVKQSYNKPTQRSRSTVYNRSTETKST